MSRGARSSARVGGFTLIEVLITLVLMSVTMTLMMAGLRYSAKAWGSAEQRMATLTDIQVARRLITTTLGQASRTIIGEDEKRRYLFEGDEKHVTFTAFMPPYPGQAGLYLTSLFIVKKEDIYQLRLKRSLLTPDIAPFDNWVAEEDVLVWQTPQQLSFSYYGPSKELNGDGSWQNQWSADEQILQLIKLTITPTNETETHWPALVVRTRFDMDGYCVDNTANNLCRLPL